MLSSIVAGLIALGLPASAQSPRIQSDPGVYGPALDVVHLYEG